MKIIEDGKEYEVTTNEKGDRFWYQKGQLHREAGPAIQLAAGGQVWYWEGKKVPARGPKEFKQQVQMMKNASVQRYYDVKVESMVPATLVFKILATSPEEAVTKIRSASPQMVQYRLQARKDSKLTVYDAGTTLIRFVKKLLGI